MKIQTKHLLCLAALGVAIVLPTQAQPVTPTPSVTTNSADEIVKMDTFTVITDKDIGYIAVDSLAGGRAAMPIKLTPSAMSSLTRAFIDDVGITDMRQALRWSLNVIPGDLQAGKGSPFNPWDYNFRGSGQSIQGGTGPTRNYFTFYQVADAYNVDRIEFDRGPNSILFGMGTIGGILNVYTKIPRLDKNFITPEVDIDSNGGFRFTIDGNWRASQTLAIRVNAIGENDKGWRKNDNNDKWAVDLGALWQITSKTQFRIDIEGSRAKDAILQSAVAEGFSAWDGHTIAPTSSTVISNASTAGLSSGAPWGTPSFWLYVPSLANKGVMDWANAYHTNGSYMPIAPYGGFYAGTLVQKDSSGNITNQYVNGHPPSQPGRDYTVGTGISRPEYYDLTAYLDQKFTDHLDGELAFYSYADSITATNYENVGNFAVDVNQQLPDGTANPNFGKTFGDFFLSKQVQQRGVIEGRAQLNFTFDAGPLKQRFSAAGSLQEVTWNAAQNQAIYTNDPATAGQPYGNIWAQDMVWARLYADNPNIPFTTPSSIGGKNITYMPPGTDWFNFDEVHKLSNAALTSHSRLWDDTLSILAGIRYDDYKYDRYQHWSGTHTHMAANHTTYAVGAVYYIYGLKWLGVFGNYSTNFDPLNPGLSNKLDGSPMTAATGKGGDAGIRISTNDGKYYASISYYDNRSENRPSNTIIGFSDYWKQYYIATNTTPDQSRTQLNYSDTEALKTHGFEFDATANPLPNLRIQASFALPKAAYIDAIPGEHAYYAKYLPNWQGAVTQGLASSDPNAVAAANTLQTELTNGQVTLDSVQAGRPQINTVKYTANVFANYTFLDGSLKGFSVGAGAVLTGRQYINTIRNTEWSTDARVTTNLVFAYTTKLFFNRETRIALNIDNVLNNRDAVITSFDGGWQYTNGNPAPNGYYLPTPITFRLSLRIAF